MDYLEAAQGFADLQPGIARVTFSLQGLPGTEEKSLQWKMKFPGLSKPKAHGHAGSAPGAGHGEHEPGGEAKPEDGGAGVQQGGHDHGSHDH